MITQRDMVMDALEMVKHEILDLTIAAEECSTQNVRQSMLQFRNQAEQTQLQLAQLASQKGWYIPSPPVDDTQVQQVKQQLQNSARMVAAAPV